MCTLNSTAVIQEYRTLCSHTCRSVRNTQQETYRISCAFYHAVKHKHHGNVTTLWWMHANKTQVLNYVLNYSAHTMCTRQTRKLLYPDNSTTSPSDRHLYNDARWHDIHNHISICSLYTGTPSNLLSAHTDHFTEVTHAQVYTSWHLV